MLGKFKKWLGIEGVKVTLDTPSEVVAEEGVVNGSLKLESISDQTVSRITVKLVEKYQRGRKKNRITDEYSIGEISFDQELTVTKEKPLSLDFKLPFKIRQSEVDEFGAKNILTGGLSKLARFAYGVNSKYRIEAEVIVLGVALNPFDKKEISLK